MWFRVSRATWVRIQQDAQTICSHLTLWMALSQSVDSAWNRDFTCLNFNILIDSSTDLKHIQTPQWVHKANSADRTFTTHWSGCRVQAWLAAWVHIWAPACHLAITPDHYSRRQSKVLLQNQWQSSGGSAQAQLGSVWQARLITGHSRVRCRCFGQQKNLKLISGMLLNRSHPKFAAKTVANEMQCHDVQMHAETGIYQMSFDFQFKDYFRNLQLKIIIYYVGGHFPEVNDLLSAQWVLGELENHANIVKRKYLNSYLCPMLQCMLTKALSLKILEYLASPQYST